MEEARPVMTRCWRMPGAPGALNNRGEVLIALNGRKRRWRISTAPWRSNPIFRLPCWGAASPCSGSNAAARRWSVCAPDARVAGFRRMLFFIAAWRWRKWVIRQEALQDYDKAIALQPDSIAAHNNRGVTLMGLRRFAKPRQATRCWKSVPRQRPALSGLAGAALHACDWSRPRRIPPTCGRHPRRRSEFSPARAWAYLSDPRCCWPVRRIARAPARPSAHAGRRRLSRARN